MVILIIPFIPLIAAGVSATASLLGNKSNRNSQQQINDANIASQNRINTQNVESQERINRAQLDWAERNYNMSKQDALERWRMENEYNSPQAQMSRLKDAGLNPHLVYGSGATATGGSIDSPQYNTPNLQAPRMSPVDHGTPLRSVVDGNQIQNILSTALMASQIEKTKAETKRIDVDQEAQAFDLAVKNKLGTDRFFTNYQNKMASENYASTKSIREFEAWAEASYAGVSSDNMNADLAGSYPTGETPLSKAYSAQLAKGELTNKALQAGFQNTVAELQNIKKKGILYDDQHALNEIEKTIKDFQGNLSKMGISPQSTQAMSVIVQLLRAVFGK